MEHFSCRGECKRTDLKLEDMKLEPYLQSKNRGICRLCNLAYEKARQIIKKAEANPEGHMVCDECDGIFSKHKTGRPRKEGTVRTDRRVKGDQIRTNCPFCKSSDIHHY